MMNYAINNILVPLDFSDTSLNALDTAVEMAKRHDAQIILLNIIENGVDDDCHEISLTSDEQSMYKERISQMDDLFNTIKDIRKINCVKSIAQGSVPAAITKSADSFNADIIIMGTHGMSGYKAFSIGSNAAHLINKVGCPILTIPPQRKWTSFKEILFPLRPVKGAIEKYRYVKNILKKNGAILKILGLSNDQQSNIDLLKDLASQLNDEVAKDEIKTSSYFKIGKNMADEVIKISTLLKTDLIIVTSTIDATFQQLFTSTYTRQIINYARVPVLCVREAPGIN